ncbi:collagen alpha-1(VII) chain-like [Dendronephthya gigantea]|uniref:collagen alpha-1(VII) chain-like n=1 Tax=Dendronephthya gigantea TaxID=151771 RepID=UPI00106D8731|nr:collagen alpha-1(VII) chain-like [Dendronephthya gigantea]
MIKLLAVVALVLQGIQAQRPFPPAAHSFNGAKDGSDQETSRRFNDVTTGMLCMKDLLLILDTSYSVEAYFESDMKPFLKNLVTDENLHVSRNGTQVALLMFSEEKKTKVLVEFGKIFDAGEMAGFIDRLNWTDIKGGYTRTDIAFQLANDKVFTQNNPRNNRPDIDDVVVIITDGNPWGVEGVLAKTIANASRIKAKGIEIVGAAVGSPEMRDRFKANLIRMSTSEEHVVETDYKDIDTIRSKLIQTTCGNIVDCQCNSTTTKTRRIAPGQSNVLVSWPTPQYSCRTGNKSETAQISVEPKITSPHAFPFGDHIIQYTFTLASGVDVVCPVTIAVRGNMCGQQAIDPGTQVCCCGAIHDERAGHDCCGTRYYDTARNKCCKDYFLLVSHQESCQ